MMSAFSAGMASGEELDHDSRTKVLSQTLGKPPTSRLGTCVEIDGPPVFGTGLD